MPTKIEIADRLKLFEKLIQEYETCFVTAENIHDVQIESANLLNDVYWETVNLNVKEFMLNKDSRINLYKVIACTEIAIMKVIPFKLPMCDTSPRKDALISLNANFALFCSITLLKDWPHDEWNDDEVLRFSSIFDESLSNINTYLKQEHLTWLNLLNVDTSYPIFICSQFWKMVSLYIEQAAGIKHRF
jgi:hypothetical protein